MNEDTKPIWAREKYILKHLGLSRSVLRAMREHGLITSVSLRNHDCRHGALLYRMSSLISHMESLRDVHGKRFIEAKYLAGFRGKGWKETLPVIATAKFVSDRLGLTRSLLRRLRDEQLVTPIRFGAPEDHSKVLFYNVKALIDLLEGMAEKQMEQSRQTRTVDGPKYRE